MNDKSHLYISIVKSIIRIIACILSISLIRQGFFGQMDNSISYLYIGLITLPIGLMIAEVLGVAEELFDKR